MQLLVRLRPFLVLIPFTYLLFAVKISLLFYNLVHGPSVHYIEKFSLLVIKMKYYFSVKIPLANGHLLTLTLFKNRIFFLDLLNIFNLIIYSFCATLTISCDWLLYKIEFWNFKVRISFLELQFLSLTVSLWIHLNMAHIILI